MNATIADPQAVITITNDDSNTPSLLSPWATQDIGAVGLTGSASYAAATKTFTVTGAGADIWGTADAFRTPISRSRVTGDRRPRRDGAEHERLGQGGRDDPRRRERRGGAGHDDGDPGDDEGEQLPAPLAANGVSTGTTGAFTGAPRWVKLTRSGNLVTAYESPMASPGRSSGRTRLRCRPPRSWGSRYRATRRRRWRAPRSTTSPSGRCRRRRRPRSHCRPVHRRGEHRRHERGRDADAARPRARAV